LPGDVEYIMSEGGMTGARGFFTRDQTGAVVGVELAGRSFYRVPTARCHRQGSEPAIRS
jgi:hypothetical protein